MVLVMQRSHSSEEQLLLHHMMALEYTNKLWKTLYIAYEVFAILLIIFPMCSMTYLFTRPQPTWSWTHAMHVAFR